MLQWCICDSVTGYLYVCDVYCGANDDGKVQHGLAESVVKQLANRLGLVGTHTTIYIDNFYQSISTATWLCTNGIESVGTVRSNSKGFPTKLFKDVEKRGDHDALIHKKLNFSVFKWKDKKTVYLLSTCHSATKVTEIESKNKNGKIEKISCPQAIADYRSHMGGVDRHNRYATMYNFDAKCMKYWHRLFYRLIESMLVDSFICYKMIHEKSNFLDFKRNVVISLIGCHNRGTKTINNLSSRLRNKLSVKENVRASPRSHRIVLLKKKNGQYSYRRCELCRVKNNKENRTIWACSDCNVPLCHKASRNCFELYHSQRNSNF